MLTHTHTHAHTHSHTQSPTGTPCSNPCSHTHTSMHTHTHSHTHTKSPTGMPCSNPFTHTLACTHTNTHPYTHIYLRYMRYFDIGIYNIHNNHIRVNEVSITSSIYPVYYKQSNYTLLVILKCKLLQTVVTLFCYQILDLIHSSN